MEKKTRNTLGALSVLLLLLLCSLDASGQTPATSSTATPQPFYIARSYWAASAAAIGLILVVLGYVIKGSWLGCLIDARNKISLSRLQIVLWTILVVSAFFAIGVQAKDMAIYLPPELWALMGITTGSAAGAVIIKSRKAQQEPAAGIAAPPAANRLGVLLRADRPRFSDMFKGEEVIDSAYVDISKVQMFFFTVAALVGYSIVLGDSDLHGTAGLSQDIVKSYKEYFPVISSALVTLIGISHAGYLTVKAAPHTPTA